MEQRVCLKCGEELNYNYQAKYCSRTCYWAGRYGEETEWSGLTVRVGKITALQMLQTGMKQKEVAKSLGVSRDVVGRLFRKQGIDEILPDRSCVVCGNSLVGTRYQKYCSKDCKYNMQYALKHPGKERVPVKINLSARNKALELHRGGLDKGSIARHLGISKKTIKSWIRRYPIQGEHQICPKAMRLRPLRHQLSDAKTLEQWGDILEVSAESAGEAKSGIIHLVCVRINGQAEWSYYASIVMEGLKMNPFSGETYAFCNVLHTAITAITWRSDTFLLTRARKASGTYLWPPEDFGETLTVSDGAFRHLLSYQKVNRTTKKYVEIP